MRIEPKHLEALAVILDRGGFTEAAAVLGTTQPALSRVVKQLEDRLQEPLFVRTRKPLEMTALGRTLADQGRAIRDAGLRASESILRLRAGTEGELRIGSTPFFMDGFVAGVIAKFQQQHPGVTVRIMYGYSADLVAQLVSGQLDMALCPLNVDDADPAVELTPLMEGRNVIACRKGHPLESSRTVRTESLLEYPWVEPPPRSPLASDLTNALLSIGANRIRIAFSGGSLGAVIAHLSESDSLAVLPHIVVSGLREQTLISMLRFEVPHPARSLSMLQARGRNKSRAEERFSEFLHNETRHLSRHMKGEKTV